MSIRLLPLSCAIAALASHAGAARAQSLATELVAEGFASPVYATAPEGDTSRLFVVEQRQGRVRIVDLAGGQVLAVPFITLPAVAQGPHQGLLGMAFHPDYAANGRFFLNFVDAGDTTRVVEFHVSPDPNVADPAPVQTLFSVPQPDIQHNGGCLQFGPDGMLYISTGDGGPSGDPQLRAQDLTDDLGKLLRLDVDLPPPYFPPDNPFVGVAGNDGIWAYGLRNPWRFSFDRATGDLYLGDVGQSSWEEVDFQPAASSGGENYGWSCYEGNAPFNTAQGCPTPGQVVAPIHEYFHSGGRSVTGGYVYRGSAIPWLVGTYFYSDFPTDAIWTFRYDGTSVTELTDRTAELQPAAGPLDLITSFGEDAGGELYVVSRFGSIHRIVAGCGAPPPASYCTSAPNASGPGALISASGPLELFHNAFRLQVAGGNPTNFGIFFYGLAPSQTAQGNGVLCIDTAAGAFRLLPALQLDASGAGALALDFGAPPMNAGAGQVVPATTYYFQFWYRDPGGPGPSDYNYSDALAATFCR